MSQYNKVWTNRIIGRSTEKSFVGDEIERSDVAASSWAEMIEKLVTLMKCGELFPRITRGSAQKEMPA
jgi:hypothetical protein